MRRRRATCLIPLIDKYGRTEGVGAISYPALNHFRLGISKLRDISSTTAQDARANRFFSSLPLPLLHRL